MVKKCNADIMAGSGGDQELRLCEARKEVRGKGTVVSFEGSGLPLLFWGKGRGTKKHKKMTGSSEDCACHFCCGGGKREGGNGEGEQRRWIRLATMKEKPPFFFCCCCRHRHMNPDQSVSCFSSQSALCSKQKWLPIVSSFSDFCFLFLNKTTHYKPNNPFPHPTLPPMDLQYIQPSNHIVNLRKASLPTRLFNSQVKKYLPMDVTDDQASQVAENPHHVARGNCVYQSR